MKCLYCKHEISKHAVKCRKHTAFACGLTPVEVKKKAQQAMMKMEANRMKKQKQ
jgi:hypothetical protein